MLVRLMYASRPAPALDTAELAAILRESRANNPQHGVTGVLCVGDGVFVQVLEGSRSAVNRLYQRIAADARHQQLELLSYEEITERRYAAWAMGQMDIARLNPALLLKYSPSAHLDPFAVSGAATAALLDELMATAAIVRSP
ncbi:MAG: BLUF domain-containing protein [Rubrivivax sp.]|jgi:hypothetical protein|nr:BLUF domain-containing protein [Rubrivivax sp.]